MCKSSTWRCWIIGVTLACGIGGAPCWAIPLVFDDYDLSDLQVNQVTIQFFENSYTIVINGSASNHDYPGTTTNSVVRVFGGAMGNNITTFGQSSKLYEVALFGGDGNDTFLHNADVPLKARGYGGADEITGGPAQDNIRGGPGNDTLRGRGDDDTLFGDEGNDDLQGQGGNDNLMGGLGLDCLSGGNGDDWLYGTDPDNGDTFIDVMEGNGGCDKFFGVTHVLIPLWTPNGYQWSTHVANEDLILDHADCDVVHVIQVPYTEWDWYGSNRNRYSIVRRSWGFF